MLVGCERTGSRQAVQRLVTSEAVWLERPLTGTNAATPLPRPLPGLSSPPSSRCSSQPRAHSNIPTNSPTNTYMTFSIHLCSSSHLPTTHLQPFTYSLSPLTTTSSIASQPCLPIHLSSVLYVLPLPFSFLLAFLYSLTVFLTLLPSQSFTPFLGLLSLFTLPYSPIFFSPIL